MFRRFKNSLFGPGLTPEALRAQLDSHSVPYAGEEVDCRTCSNPCDEGHEAYPNNFKVDLESAMVGSVDSYARQVVISTGKEDWDREITWTKGSLAAHIQHVHHSSKPSGRKTEHAAHVPGIFNSSDATELSILNGSHRTISDDSDLETVLIFPDYVMVTEIPRSLDGARALWNSCLAPNIPQAGSEMNDESPLGTWVIPYACVILLCSHKRRDKRCSIAATLLGQAFVHTLEDHGWTVDTEIEHPAHQMNARLEEHKGTDKEHAKHITEQLQKVASDKKALILRNSHTGGHRYAGNCIIYTPQRAGVWYGRVSTHEVESIVSTTIEKGLILPTLLRGGMNLSRPGCSSLHDW